MRIDDSGVTPTSLAEYVSQLEAAFRRAFGANLNLGSETPQGQLIGIDALARAQADEVAVSIANGLNLQTASGVQLDALGSLLRIQRLPARSSSVEVTLTGTSGTVLPVGTGARTSDGHVFRLRQETTIPASGTINAFMDSEDTGAIVALAGELTEKVDAITGWSTVNNAAAAALGADRETDAEYRERYQTLLESNAQGSRAAIEAALFAVPGVLDARVIENATSSALALAGVSLPVGNVLCIVNGGEDDAIASAISLAKPVGIATTGNVNVSLTQPGGETLAVSFYRVVPVPVRVTVATTIALNFPSDGELKIKQRTADWVSGNWSSGPGDFETDGIGIGETIAVSRLYGPINSVPGHVVTSLAITLANGSALPAQFNVFQQATLTPDNVVVTTTEA